jgi:hypothetical protein
MYGPLNDPQFIFILLVLSCAAVITIGAIVTGLTRVPRSEFARLRDEVKHLSKKIKALEAAEERRFQMELKSAAARHPPGSQSSRALKRAISSE